MLQGPGGGVPGNRTDKDKSAAERLRLERASEEVECFAHHGFGPPASSRVDHVTKTEIYHASRTTQYQAE